MINRALSRLTQRAGGYLTSPSVALFSIAQYQPPASKLQEFTENIVQLQDESSFRKAAELLATLEADQSIYTRLLADLSGEIAKYEQLEPQVVNTLRVRATLEQEVRFAEEEKEGIVGRSNKEIDNVRVYGVTRIAKEIIEVADHLVEAIAVCEQKGKRPYLDQLHNIYQELTATLKTYQIYPVDPTNQYFDPNEHHSIAHKSTQDPTKVNLVAETKRVGWKLRARVLREAYVVIYK